LTSKYKKQKEREIDNLRREREKLEGQILRFKEVNDSIRNSKERINSSLQIGCDGYGRSVRETSKTHW